MVLVAGRRKGARKAEQNNRLTGEEVRGLDRLRPVRRDERDSRFGDLVADFDGHLRSLSFKPPLTRQPSKLALDITSVKRRKALRRGNGYAVSRAPSLFAAPRRATSTATEA